MSMQEASRAPGCWQSSAPAAAACGSGVRVICVPVEQFLAELREREAEARAAGG